MSYNYETERTTIFSEEGQRTFLRIRDHVKGLLEKSGAFSMGSALSTPHMSGDTWTMMACVDRLVELGEITEVPRGPNCPGQCRIFVKFGE